MSRYQGFKGFFLSFFFFSFFFFSFFFSLINIDHSEKIDIYIQLPGSSSWLFLLLVIRLTISNATSAKPVTGLWTRRFIAMVLIARYIVEVSFAIQQNSIARLSFFFFRLLLLFLSSQSLPIILCLLF